MTAYGTIAVTRYTVLKLSFAVCLLCWLLWSKGSHRRMNLERD